MEDVSPGLLEKLRALFLALLGEDAPDADTYAAAGDYAERVGDALAEAFRQQLSGDVLPDGKMYWNIADRVVRPLLEEDWRLCAGAAADVQRALNKAAGLGLAPQASKPDQDRIDGILHTLCAAERYEDQAWMLDEPVRTFSRAAVDETLRCNAEFQFRAGLRPRIIRTAEAGCCKWCSALAGVYNYPDVPRDVYRRHASCRCTVEYDPGGGKRQDVWTKRWTDEETLERRKNIHGIDTTPRVREIAVRNNEPENVLPEYLRNATPNSHTVKDLQSYTVNGVTYTVDGHSVQLDYSAHEKEIAELLEKKLGGEIFMVPKVNIPQRIRTPDYLFRGEAYDLKTLKPGAGANTIFNRVKKAAGQSQRFIIDATHSGLEDNTIDQQIEKIFTRSDTDWVEEVFIIRGDTIFRIVKRT